MLRFFLFLTLAFSVRAGSFTSENDVEYGRVNGKPLLLDVVRPDGKVTPPRPAVVFVHGGGWIIGDKSGVRPRVEEVARQGFVCFNINYRLAFGAENNWPAAVEDAQRAVRWVRANAARYGVDSNRIGAIGDSAGGHIVSFLGTTDTINNSDPALAKFSSRAQCVVDLFGPTDLTEDYSAKVAAGLSSNDMVRQFLGGTPAQKPEAARAASPLWRVDAKSAPFLIFHGRLDVLVPPDHSERLHAALQKAGVESKLVMFENEGHGFKKKETRDKFAAETLAFLKKHLRP
jgi:acetyl esterase/lipase